LTPNFYWGPYQTLCEEHERTLDTFRMFTDAGALDVAALDAKLELYRSELERVFNVFHGEVVKVDSTLTQIGQLLFGQRPVAHQASPQVQAPAPLQVVQAQPVQQPETPYHVRFIPPVRAQQVDAHGNPLPQS
jgi:hypothetical protein